MNLSIAVTTECWVDRTMRVSANDATIDFGATSSNGLLLTRRDERWTMHHGFVCHTRTLAHIHGTFAVRSSRARPTNGTRRTKRRTIGLNRHFDVRARALFIYHLCKALTHTRTR